MAPSPCRYAMNAYWGWSPKDRVMSPRRDTGRGPEERCWFSST
jgi:hypothetical protein